MTELSRRSLSLSKFCDFARILCVAGIVIPALHCSKLKTDTNCLNPASSCFVADVTRPQVRSQSPMGTVSKLDSLTVTFSEELKNITDTTVWEISGDGKGQLHLKDIQRVEGTYTYVLNFDNPYVSNGSIIFTPKTTDYNGNTLSSAPPGLTGSTVIGITFSNVTHDFITQAGGFTSTTVDFVHDLPVDPQDATSTQNSWIAYLNSADCSGTPVAQGTGNVAGGVVQQITVDTSAGADATPNNQIVSLNTIGANLIRICYSNPAKNRYGSAAISITRDDSAPYAWASPAGGAFGTPGTISLFCDDNCLRIAYTTDGSPPAMDMAGAITNGNAYTATIAMPYISDPTNTTLQFLAADKAGKLTSITTHNFTVDTRIPQITVTANPYTYLTDGTGVTASPVNTLHTSSTVLWQTNIPARSEFRIAANCGGATWGAAPGTSNSSAILVTAPLAVGANPVTLCARESATNTHIGSNTLTFFRDDTNPVFGGLLSVSNTASGQALLSWIAATDASPVEYIICQTTTPTGCDNGAFTATYGGDGSITGTSYTISGLNVNQTYYFAVQARDATGRATYGGPTLQWTSPLLKIQLTGLPGAGNLNISRTGSSSSDSLSLTANGTYAFPTPLFIGDVYNLQITSLIPTTGSVCSIGAAAYGQIASMTTIIPVNCAPGYMVGGLFRALPAATLKYLPFQGKVTAFAGSGAAGFANATPATSGTLNGPDHLVSDGTNLFISDVNNRAIRKIVLASNALSTHIQATGVCTADALATQGFIQPMAMATDGTSLFIADHQAHIILRVPVAGGTLTRVAGTGAGCSSVSGGSSNDNDNPLNATFNGIHGLVFHNGYLYISEYYGQKIRRLNLTTGQVSTVLAGMVVGDIAVIGNYLYFANTPNNQIRRLDLSSLQLDGGFSIGSGTVGFRDGALASAQLNNPLSLVTDGRDLYFSEYHTGTGGRRVRRADLVRNTVSLVAGPAFELASAPGALVAQPGARARFRRARGLAMDGRNLYLADADANQVVRISDNALHGLWLVNPGVNPYDYNSDGGAVRHGSGVGGFLGTTTDRFAVAGGASTFNGSSQYFTAGSGGVPVDMDAALTLSAWIKVTDLTAEHAIMGTGSFRFRWNVATDGSIYFQNWYGGGASSNHLVSSSPRLITAGTWAHVAYTYRPNSPSPGGRIFFNGHEVTQGSTNTGNTSDAVNVPLTIAYSTASAIQTYLKGSVTDVRIYNRELNGAEINELAQDASAAQVAASYNSGATGLLAHHDFINSGLSDTAALGLTLTNTGSSGTVIGKDSDPGGAFYFTSTSQYLQNAAADGLPLESHPRTMCAWIRPHAQPAPGFRYPIISYGSASTAGNASELVYYDNTTGDYRLSLTKIGSSVDALVKLPINTWSHACVSNDGANTVIYWNGIAQPAITGSAQTLTTTAGPLYIGKRVKSGAPDSTYFFNGAIDDPRIYNSALTADQIRQISIQVPKGLMARYDFAGDAKDVSGFGNHATNSGATAAANRLGQTSAFSYSTGQFHRAPAQPYLSPTDMTIMAWIKPNSLPNAGDIYPIAGNMQADASRGAVLELYNNAGVQSIYWLNKINLTTNNDYIASYAIPGNFNHIAITRSGTTRAVYLNGASLPSSPAGTSGGDSTSTEDFFIGKRIDSATVSQVKFFDGVIADVRIYNRALLPTEIAAISGYHPLQASTGVSSVALHVQADTVAAADGASVGTWTDSGPAGNTLTGGVLPTGCTGTCNPQINPTFRASNLNGKPAIRFDSGNDIMTKLAPAGVTQNSSVFSVGTPIVVGGTLMLAGNPLNGISVYFTGGSLGMDSRLIPPICLKTTSTFSAGNPWLTGYSFLTSPVTRHTYTNGVDDTSGAGPFCGSPSFGLVTSSITVGSDGANAGHYDLNELIYYNAQVSAGDALLIHCYLSSKYGLPLSSSAICP